jgi:hypothetical protein
LVILRGFGLGPWIPFFEEGIDFEITQRSNYSMEKVLTSVCMCSRERERERFEFGM